MLLFGVLDSTVRLNGAGKMIVFSMWSCASRREVNDLGKWMTITKERKSSLISEFKRADSDTGSPEIQISVLTFRINSLTDHMRTHKKDYASRRGLLMMVSRRRRLLDYLKKIDPQRYLDIIGRLEIRK